MKKTKKIKKCDRCFGFGMWPDGAAPMGPIDGSDGMPTIACPKCGANKNPSHNIETKWAEQKEVFDKKNVHKSYTKQLNGKWTWKIVLFNPKSQFAFCTIDPGFQKEFDTKEKCDENMEMVIKELELK